MIIKYATVTSTAPFKVKFDIDSVESQNTNYKRLESYTPQVNDRVVFINDLCLGKVVK